MAAFLLSKGNNLQFRSIQYDQTWSVAWGFNKFLRFFPYSVQLKINRERDLLKFVFTASAECVEFQSMY